MKPTILTFVAHYLPGYKSGGPVRTIANLVDHLGDEFDFKILTSDRDATDKKPYTNISVNNWNQVGKAKVYYLSPKKRNLWNIKKLIQSTAHDIIYLNSFFNPSFTMLPLIVRRLGRIQSTPLIIAPRGEFSKGALSLKQWKKKFYFFVVNAACLYRGLTWQASSNHELEDISKQMGKTAKNISVAANLSPAISNKETFYARKPNEPLKIVFLSRITPKKNLDFALRVLGKIKLPVVFNIYGPIRDEGYWKICRNLLKSLPSHVTARFHGPVFPAKVPEIMAAHDLFFLPTLGENYGHVIPEALYAGTPVLISNTTPWRELETAGVGWDINLKNIDTFAQCIEKCAAYSIEEYTLLRDRVKAFAYQNLSNPMLVQANRCLFENTANQT